MSFDLKNKLINGDSLKELKKIQCVESYYIGNKKGYSIYSLKNNELK